MAEAIFVFEIPI